MLITGVAGMLGREIADIFRKDKKYAVYGIIRNSGPKKINITCIKADLRDLKKLKRIVAEIKPDIIIHCAALVNLDACEENKRDANLVHVRATKVLSSYKPDRTKFVYISTDSVFGGISGNYGESDKPGPLNYYARSKLAGEKAALTANENSLVIRTNIYGFHNPPGNSLAEWALRNFSLKESVSGFTDVVFNPVYTKQLARIIKYILDKKHAVGVLNVGSAQFLNKHEFLKFLAQNFGISREAIKPALIGSSVLETARPKNTTLNTSKLQEIIKGKTSELSLPKGLAEFKKDYLKEFKRL